MANPLVSVVLPAFNRSESIERTVASVCAQTHRNLQIVVVGSVDGIAQSDPRIEIFSGPFASAAVARNEGIRVARGAFVAFTDADTQWRLWKIEAQLRCLEAIPGCGMIWTDMDAARPSGEVFSRRHLA